MYQTFSITHIYQVPNLGEVALILFAVFNNFGQMYLFNMWRPVSNSDSSSGCSHHLRRPADNNKD